MRQMGQTAGANSPSPPPPPARTWPILTGAFGALTVLIVLSGFSAFQQAAKIYQETVRSHEAYQRVSAMLAALEADLYRAEITLRDYLLDPSFLTGPKHREELLSIRREMELYLKQLSSMEQEDGLMALARLRGELDNYWVSLEPVFEWTPSQKLALSSVFLRARVLPQRRAVSQLAREIREANEANLAARQSSITRQQEAFARDLRNRLILSFGLALAVTIAVTLRLNRLERREREHRLRAEEAEAELRDLSHQLVRTQEDERKHLSRELHDAVGQTLTALRMEIGNIERNHASGEAFAAAVAEAKQLAEKSLRTVRDLAMGLRPSMLDDLGLGPAVEWQARDYSRRSGTPVNVEIEGNVDLAPESHRICIYRVLQEALTNCAKHASARNIRVVLSGRKDGISLTVQDDGVGMAKDKRGRGLGLLSIEERVRQLEGTLRIHSHPGSGMVLSVDIPYRRSRGHSDGEDSNLAG